MHNSQFPARHPGRILERFIQGKGLSQKQFAEIIGKSPTDVSHIISGQKSINVDYAIRISIVFDTSPEVWLGMQQAYDAAQLQKPSGKENEYNEVKSRLQSFSFA